MKHIFIAAAPVAAAFTILAALDLSSASVWIQLLGALLLYIGIIRNVWAAFGEEWKMTYIPLAIGTILISGFSL